MKTSTLILKTMQMISSKPIKHALKAFYEAGVRYLQLDDVYIARLSAPDFQFKDGKYTREQLIDLALRVINGALEGKPEDLSRHYPPMSRKLPVDMGV